MVRHYMKIVFYIFVFCVVCEGNSDGVFIVYPFKEGDIIEATVTLPMRKFESKVRRNPKMLNNTNLHLVYPTYEDIMIMTPAPLLSTQKPEDFSLDTTTLMDSSTELFSDFITTTEIVESIEENKDGTTTSYGDSDLTTIADLITTEMPTEINKSAEEDQSSIDVSIYEETGPKKKLRKRMFEASKIFRKYPSGLKINNDMKIPTTISPKDAFKNWYRKTGRNKAITVSEKIPAKTKTILKNPFRNYNSTERNSSENVKHRRYNVRTYKKRVI